MGDCTKCTHFRPVRPLSAVLAREAGTSDPAVLQALGELRRVETQELAAESQFLVAPQNVELSEWGFRPRMSPYCATHEAEGLYEIPQNKNAGGRCKKDYQEGPPPSQSCATCAHMRVPAGDIADAAMAHDYFTRATWDSNLSFQHTSIPQAQSVFSQAGQIQAVELTQAFQSGAMFAPPRYMKWCGAFSAPQEGKFVSCAAQNPHDSCPRWTP